MFSLRRSRSLHLDNENEIYEKSKIITCYICNELFLIGEYSFRTKMVIIYNILRKNPTIDRMFHNNPNHLCFNVSKYKGI